MDFAQRLRGRVDHHLKTFVDQRQRRDAARLQTGQRFGFALAGQGHFLFTERGGQQFQVHFAGTGDDHQQGFARPLAGEDDRLENRIRRNVQETRRLQRAEFFRRRLENRVGDLARVQQSGHIGGDGHFYSRAIQSSNFTASEAK